MPFTLAHPAAVLPLRRYVPFSALIVGSLSPDFEYIVRLAPVSRFSHTPLGILYFCVPIGLVFLWLFHRLIKHPAFHLLPSHWQDRLEPILARFRFWPARQFLLVVSALAVGALSHVIWDSFTHENGWMVERVSALRVGVFTIAGYELKVYKLIQHSSSLAGLLVLSYFFLVWLRRQPRHTPRLGVALPERVRRRVVLAIVLFTLAASFSFGFWSVARYSGLQAFQVFIVQFAIGGMLAFTACIFLYGLLVRVVHPRLTRG